MKTDKEIVKDLLERREQYETEKSNKRKILTRTLAPVCCVCLMTLIGIGVWQGGIIQGQLPSRVNDGTQTDIKNTSAEESVSSSEQAVSIKDTSEKETAPSYSEQTANPRTEGDSQATSTPSGDSNYFILFAGEIEWNGVTYRDSDTPNASAYTRDKFIGKAGDLNSRHEDTVNYRISSDDSIYTVKETSDVLFAVKEDGKIVVLVSPDWSLEKYEPERLEKGFIEPNAPAEAPVVINDFCDIIYTSDNKGNVTYVNPDHADLAEKILSSEKNDFCRILLILDNDGNIIYTDPNSTDLIEKIISSEQF